MDERLLRFVDHARKKGMDHATIRQLLVSAGWKDHDVAEVFCTRDLELSIPKPTVGRCGAGSRPAGIRLATEGAGRVFSTC